MFVFVRTVLQKNVQVWNKDTNVCSTYSVSGKRGSFESDHTL